MEAGQKSAVCSFAHRKASFQRANAFAQSVAKFGHAIFLLGERPRQIVFDHADQLVCRLAQRAAFVRPAYGGPVFRRCALRVLAPPAASRPPTASDRDGNAFLPQTQAFALQKMPEMTYTPSFLIRTFFFRDFVNGLFARPPLDAGQCVFGWISPQKRVIVHSSFKQALNSVIVSSAIVKHTQEGKIIGSEQT